MNRTSTMIAIAIAIAAMLAAGAPAYASSSPTASAAAECMTTSQIQGISKMKSIGCKTAQKTVDKAFASGVRIPECTHQKTVKWNGWTLTGLASKKKHEVIATRFKKGSKSFVLAGGGAC